jgi:hypothetical protein
MGDIRRGESFDSAPLYLTRKALATLVSSSCNNRVPFRVRKCRPCMVHPDTNSCEDENGDVCCLSNVVAVRTSIAIIVVGVAQCETRSNALLWL